MTLMYYAVGDTQEKYGWDLHSAQGPPVPRCVSRKYQVTWKRASTQTKKRRVADYAACMMEKDEEGATERGASGILAGILSAVYQKTGGKCDGKDNQYVINAVKAELMDEINQQFNEKLKIVDELEAKVDEVTAEAVKIIDQMQRKVEDLEAKVDGVTEAEDVGPKHSACDDLRMLSSSGPKHSMNQPRLYVKDNINEDEAHVALQWQLQSQSQCTYHTCRYTQSQKPEEWLHDLDHDEFEKSKPEPKAWDHGWDSD